MHTPGPLNINPRPSTVQNGHCNRYFRFRGTRTMYTDYGKLYICPNQTLSNPDICQNQKKKFIHSKSTLYNPEFVYFVIRQYIPVPYILYTAVNLLRIYRHRSNYCRYHVSLSSLLVVLSRDPNKIDDSRTFTHFKYFYC